MAEGHVDREPVRGERAEVGGDVESRRLGDLRSEIADVHGAGLRAAIASRMAGTATTARMLVHRQPGRPTMWSAASMGSRTPSGLGASGGTTETPEMRPAL